MKLRTSQLFLIALVGGGFGAWYGMRFAEREDKLHFFLADAARGNTARAYFCHAPPEVALPHVEARVEHVESKPPFDEPRLNEREADYFRAELAMLNERLGRGEQANAQWTIILGHCRDPKCTRETWRERVQNGCKQ
ncbi:MAG: hypothetical protein AB7K71_24495 [Polyangiaceae bacterium]